MDIRMKQLFEPIKIRNRIIKNRICIPPMVCFNFSDNTGFVTEQNIDHYRAIAKGHPGLIIQEATCITPDGKLHESQLGIWSDAHVDGLKQIVNAVHEEGCPIILQIHHAGIPFLTLFPLQYLSDSSDIKIVVILVCIKILINCR